VEIVRPHPKAPGAKLSRKPSKPGAVEEQTQKKKKKNKEKSYQEGLTARPTIFWLARAQDVGNVGHGSLQVLSGIARPPPTIIALGSSQIRQRPPAVLLN